MQILYEDNHLIAINKKSGDIVQGDKTGDTPLSEKVKSYIKEKYKKPGAVYLAVVHRIDRPVTGVIIFSRTSKSAERMSELFRSREIKKTYWAVVKNKPPEEQDHLIHYLKKNEKQNKSYAVAPETSDALKSELDYKLLASSDRYFLLEVNPLTGRHHQIRAQLAAIGCPIKGDLKYGYPRSNADGSVHLHARAVNFIHPVTKEKISITAPVADEKVWKIFEEMVQ